MAAELDEMVAGFRNRRLDGGALHLPVDGRADAEGPRGRPDRERALPGRDRA